MQVSEDMKKDKLQEIASEKGLEFTQKDTKADLVSMINGAGESDQSSQKSDKKTEDQKDPFQSLKKFDKFK